MVTGSNHQFAFKTNYFRRAFQIYNEKKKKEASVRLRRDNCGDLNQRLSYAGQNLPTCSRFRCKGGMLQVLYWRPIKPLDFKAIGWKYSEERDSGNSFWNLSKLSILLNVFIPLEMSWNLLRLYLHDVNGVGFKSFLFLINSFLLRKINLQIFFPFLSLLLSFQKKTKQQARFTARTEKKTWLLSSVLHLKYQGPMLKRIPRDKFPILWYFSGARRYQISQILAYPQAGVFRLSEKGFVKLILMQLFA